ncbi:MAG: 2-keto-3-deoxygluconate permease, partial [Planctomycetes bacterium]|nr:2-keto-3-deoxygluconate permease [Planctomycetota bacterium]
SFQPYVSVATIQVSAAIIISALVCPLLVDFLARRQRRREGTPDSEVENDELRKEIGQAL